MVIYFRSILNVKITLIFTDHTTQTEYGRFMFVERNEEVTDVVNPVALLASIKNTYTSPKCLGFYYTMSDAPGVNKLMVMIRTETNFYPIWSKQKDTGRKVCFRNRH